MYYRKAQRIESVGCERIFPVHTNPQKGDMTDVIMSSAHFVVAGLHLHWEQRIFALTSMRCGIQ